MTLDNWPKPPSSYNDRVTIPDGWCPRKLADISDIRPSNVDKKSVFGEIPVHLCNYLDVYNHIAITDDLDFMKATATLAEIERFAVEPGDVIITKDSETPDDIGVPAVSLATVPDLVCGYHLTLIKPNQSVEPSFLASQIAHDRISRYFRLHANGSTRFGLTVSTIANTPIWLPPLSEQRRIAEILDAADAAIRRTERVIAKLREVKRGLLHDLLTRGLDADGNLRDPVAHPEQFKDSSLGRIPREWGITKLVDHFAFPSGQIDPTQEPYRNWPLIAPDHIESETGRLLDTETAAEQNAISGKYIFEPGDVVYSKIRPYLRKATLVGQVGLCSADMYPLRPLETLNSRFLLALILGERFSRFAVAVSMRSGFPKINRDEMGEYVTALPSIEEQRRIAAVLEAHDDHIRAEVAVLAKRRQVKRGLMEDLLTGRVRVEH